LRPDFVDHHRLDGAPKSRLADDIKAARKRCVAERAIVLFEGPLIALTMLI
jgi:hypothetical protein